VADARGVRVLLPCLLVSALWAQAPDRQPSTGKRVAAFAAVESAVLATMTRVDATAATLAISRDGVLRTSRGFGYKDRGKIAPVPADALFRIASISKPFTAAAVRAAERAKRLDLDAKAFALIDASPPSGKKLGDPRLADVTVRHLLEHQGGWDRAATFDPMFQVGEARRALQIDHDVTPRDLIAWMLAQPLQFTPGEKEVYSNFGYCVLGRVLEHALEVRTYFEALQQTVLRPHGIVDVKLGRSAMPDPREVWYAGKRDAPVMEVLDACGGLIASAPALCMFMDRYWLSGEPRGKAERQQWFFFGSLEGTTAMVRQTKDGWNVAVLLNARRGADVDADHNALLAAVDAGLARVENSLAERPHK
jgi:CubicO group peptidase (beta-lactamase class C family)